MSVGFPLVTEYRNMVPTRTLDPTTTSGFAEDPNVTHAHFTQLSDGWIMHSGRTSTAYLDRQGRLGTVTYRFWLPFTNWIFAGDPLISVTVHEFGDLIVLDFGPSQQTANIDAALPISNSAELPVSLRPKVRKTKVINVLDNGAQKLGTVEIVGGDITIWAGPLGTNFTPAALGGFLNFQMIYNKNVDV